MKGILRHVKRVFLLLIIIITIWALRTARKFHAVRTEREIRIEPTREMKCREIPPIQESPESLVLPMIRNRRGGRCYAEMWPAWQSRMETGRGNKAIHVSSQRFQRVLGRLRRDKHGTAQSGLFGYCDVHCRRAISLRARYQTSDTVPL